MRGGEKGLKILHRAVAGMDVHVIGDVVAVVAQRRGKKRQQPQAGDAQVLQIIELLNQAREIADAVVVAVGESAHVQLVDDRVLVPQGIRRAAWTLHGHAPPRSRRMCAGRNSGRRARHNCGSLARNRYRRQADRCASKRPRGIEAQRGEIERDKSPLFLERIEIDHRHDDVIRRRRTSCCSRAD